MTEAFSNALEGIALRPFVESDLLFLFHVYAASRDREMALLTHWSDAEKEAFLQDQFRLQHSHYQTHYPDARFDLILDQSNAIGRLYVAELKSEIRLMDIALLPEYRGQGIGSALMQELMERAAASGKLVSLHVEEYNPARRLYERLGFQMVGDAGLYKLMHWMPPGMDPESPDREDAVE